MTGKGMKLSSFTKYLHLRVINTGVVRAAAAMPVWLMLSVCPSLAQQGRAKPSDGEVQTVKVRGDVTGVPYEYFRMLGEAARKQHEADSASLRAGQAVQQARNAGTDQRERYYRKAMQDSTRAAARKAEADSLLLAVEKAAGCPPEAPGPATIEETPASQLSRFDVLPGQAYTQSNPVPVEPGMPGGLVYTIQIAAFKNDVTPSIFRGLTPVFGRKRQGSEALYYFAGLFRRLDDARRALPEARGAGFPDAFIIALLDGTQVSLERAAHLEKEWGSRPLDGDSAVPGGTKPAAGGTKSSAGGTRPEGGGAKPGATTSKHSAGASEPVAQTPPVPIGTLSFRAEVMRIDKPVKPEVVQKIEVLAGNRGLDMIKNSNGETVFLIGNFITFESADEYVSLLVRNGYGSARVAAYVDRQEIPVEAARELVNKMPDD